MLLKLSTATLRLLPELAAFDPAGRTVFVADLHLGKAAAFREAGIPLPDGSDAATLDALDAVLRRVRARNLVILGDVFHARITRRETLRAQLDDWRARHASLALTIIPGNHDRRICWDDWLPDAVVLAEGAETGPWTLFHCPPDRYPGRRAALCGHLHPGVVLGSRCHGWLKSPCFHLAGNVLTLPAFGRFTGLSAVRPGKGDRCFVPLRDSVVEVPRPRGASPIAMAE